MPGWGPISTCLVKNISTALDAECPVSSGCFNGGSCFNGSCCCPSSFTGKFLFSFSSTRETDRFAHRQGRLCETPINPCAINPCQNNGLCSATASGYQCQCSIYYTGALCEITLNPCDYSPCRNGATCRFVGNTTVFNCTCAPGRFDRTPHPRILR